MINIGILGGGPAALFLVKQLLEQDDFKYSLTIIEKSNQLGAGMPYSKQGACPEHVTNVSDNEIPGMVTTIREWVDEAPPHLLQQYNINPDNFNEYKVLPRLFFGEYLTAQFDKLLAKAKQNSIPVKIYYNTEVLNIFDDADNKKIKVHTAEKEFYFDKVIICTGHNWQKKHEGKTNGWFDSPYPPSKITGLNNYPVAVRGASLSAIDAIKTLARNNGTFSKNEKGVLQYQLNDSSPNFKIVMHSLYGLM
ncbi:MAG: FAD/NAD(P)-binding protein, partial [Ferruginibacter sp.]